MPPDALGHFSSLGSALFLLEEAADDRLGGLLHEYQWAA